MVDRDPIARFQQVSDWRDAAALLAVPPAPGVFSVAFAAGPPYLGKTANLRRRLRRLLLPREGAARRLTLRDIARVVRYCPTGSRFESDLLLYKAARIHRPEDWQRYLKLRPPAFVKVLLQNRFPRTCLTHRLTRSKALFFGPFGTRRAAEQFQQAFLDLFLVRRCTENLQPAPEHPGCIWGEMERCLRPCQAACDDGQYGSEVDRLTRFLCTDGDSFLRETEAARDRASAAMEFEAAAKHHGVLAKAKDVLRLRDGLSRELDELNGIVLQPSAAPRAIEATPVYKGTFQNGARISWESQEPKATLFAAQFRALLASADWSKAIPSIQGNHLALLQRWHGSSYRKGEFVPFARADTPPIRKLANAAMRLAKNLGGAATAVRGEDSATLNISGHA